MSFKKRVESLHHFCVWAQKSRLLGKLVSILFNVNYSQALLNIYLDIPDLQTLDVKSKEEDIAQINKRDMMKTEQQDEFFYDTALFSERKGLCHLVSICIGFFINTSRYPCFA